MLCQQSDLTDATVRQIFHLSVGGPALRVHLSQCIWNGSAACFVCAHCAAGFASIVFDRPGKRSTAELCREHRKP